MSHDEEHNSIGYDTTLTREDKKDENSTAAADTTDA